MTYARQFVTNELLKACLSTLQGRQTGKQVGVLTANKLTEALDICMKNKE